ncbi:F-box domain, cyclin-like protein [Artemisia annua]|uniref:F-box domain, cyclin-like protein n=1 Tax=Artemisia annua TaxID=35608 RepID=A0A2U1NWG1_ARTAN|nr:F-box domain, cyclin-like protein [Artemisia annua]
MQGHLPHPVPHGGACVTAEAYLAKRGKRRGSYNCGRCGMPKKGHVCHLSSDVTSPSDSVTSSAAPAVSPLQIIRPFTNLRRALSFDEDLTKAVVVKVEEVEIIDDDVAGDVAGGGGGGDGDDDVEVLDDDVEMELGGRWMPTSVVWEVMRRLPPASLLSAAKVCKGWRDLSKRMWKCAEELRIKVPGRIQVGFVGSVLRKCDKLVRLVITMESDMDSTMLACIAFACPNLESLEIYMCEGAFNRITGEELGRFVADKRCLTTLKVEGCSNLGGFVLCSNTLSTLWLSDLHSLSKMVFNLPNLNEIALRFSRQENDRTDLTSMMDGLGRSCAKLQYIQIASLQLSHSVVLSLTAANLRGLRMLSLVFGSEVTDASVVAISKSYSNLELLDLSGSSISDSGIGMICNVFPDTLTRLLVSQCPNITSSGIQFATAQLPLLELMDCGMTICEPDARSPFCEANGDSDSQVSPNSKLHLIHQKLFIKHARLKKLSLWGCSSLDSLYLNCPNLSELNLNSCKTLLPEKLVLQCSKLETVHAVGCPDVVVQAVKTQVSNDPAPSEDSYSRKRMADGSKRVGIPFSFSQPSPDDGKGSWTVRKRRCTVIVE